MYGQDDVTLPVRSLLSVKFPKAIKPKSPPAQIGNVLMEFLRKLATVNMEPEKKKERYYLVTSFLDFVHNF
jgi:hypothetical protein